MNIFFKKAQILLLLVLISSCNTSSGGNDNTYVNIKTTLGDIKLKLYDNTPLHRDNFIKLINANFYDGISFHRVIKDFMIQAGDPATKAAPNISIPDTLKTYTIPAEISAQNYHKKGALAAARQGNDINPEMRSSGTQFYIVQGVKSSDDELNAAEQRINAIAKQTLFNKLIKQSADSVRMAGKTVSDGEIQEISSIKMFQYLSTHKDYRISDEQRIVYKTAGGTPRLDASYTVFGEVVEGLDVVDRIAAVSTDSNDKPVTDIRIIKIKIERK